MLSDEDKAAAAIVEAIVVNLMGLGGLGDAWYSIDPDIREEIQATWRTIALERVNDLLRSRI